MQKINALFLMFLLSLNIITSTYTSTETETTTDLEDISPIEPIHGYHSQLIQMLAEAQSDTPRTVAEFSKSLLKMLHNLMAAQAKHEEINKKMNLQCKKEAAFRQKAIDDAQNALNASSSALSKCQASKAAAVENKPALLKANQDYSDQLAKKTAERARQHGLYVQRAKDWKDAVAFLDEFIKMVNQKLNNGHPTSFADLGENLLKHVSRLGLVAEAVPVFIALAQSPAENDVSLPHASNNYQYQAQGKTVNNLNTQLTNLRNKLGADAKQNDLNEEKALKLFNELKGKLEAIIGKLRSDITKTEKQIKDMDTCISTEDSVIASAGNKLQRNKKLMAAAGETCNDFASEFVKATNNRNEEITVVQQIIAIVQKRFKQLPQELVSYLEEVKNHFKVYVNSTQFKKYVKYVEKHIADNAHGKKLSAAAVRAKK